MLNFVDVFSSYNQIRMALEKKMSFITDKGLYYYKVISFRLMNASGIYRHLVNNIFKYQISRNMKVYINSMLVKSCQTN